MLGNMYVLRIIAILLIVNAHLASFYPSPSMAFGGHMGNSIFYLISGFGLALSYCRKPLPAVQWYIDRFVKLFVPLIVVTAFVSYGSWSKCIFLLEQFLFPGSLDEAGHFIPTLILLYILFVPLASMALRWKCATCIIILLISLVAFYFMPAARHHPSLGYFFISSAFICFFGGIILQEVFSSTRLFYSRSLQVFFLFMLLVSQAAHFLILKLYQDYIFLNHYINIVSVVSLFVASFLMSMSSTGLSIVKKLALSSLGVYLIHFEFISFFAARGLNSSFSIFYIIFMSFSVAITISSFTDMLSCMMLRFIRQLSVKDRVEEGTIGVVPTPE